MRTMAISPGLPTTDPTVPEMEPSSSFVPKPTSAFPCSASTGSIHPTSQPVNQPASPPCVSRMIGKSVKRTTTTTTQQTPTKAMAHETEPAVSHQPTNQPNRTLLAQLDGVQHVREKSNPHHAVRELAKVGSRQSVPQREHTASSHDSFGSINRSDVLRSTHRCHARRRRVRLELHANDVQRVTYRAGNAAGNS